MSKTKLRQNFIYPELNAKHAQYGASLLQAPILREDGDWRTNYAEQELQQKNGVEQSSCFMQALQHAWESVEDRKLGEQNKYDARFNAFLAGGTEKGGDPVLGADSAMNDGMIPEGMMGYDYSTWDEYHSWKGADETRCRAAGNADLYLYSRNFGVVITKELPLATKFQILKEGLKRSPMPISIYGQTDFKGSYIQKPKGVSDTHLVEARYVSPDNKITILDTYPPFIKELPANYDMDFGMIVTSEEKAVSVNATKDVITRFLSVALDFCKGVLEYLKLKKEETPVQPPHPALTLTEQTPTELLKKYCLESLGKDLSDFAPNELGCADSLSSILKRIFPDFPSLVSTVTLRLHIDLDKRFARTQTEANWLLIISPTDEQTKQVGHCGILGENGIVYSNNSDTGLWDKHWTLPKWIDYFKVQKKLKLYFYELIG